MKLRRPTSKGSSAPITTSFLVPLLLFFFLWSLSLLGSLLPISFLFSSIFHFHFSFPFTYPHSFRLSFFFSNKHTARATGLNLNDGKGFCPWGISAQTWCCSHPNGRGGRFVREAGTPRRTAHRPGNLPAASRMGVCVCWEDGPSYFRHRQAI